MVGSRRGERQGVDSYPIAGHERIANEKQRLRPALECFEGGRDLVGLPDLESSNFEPECAGGRLNLFHLQHGGGVPRIR